MFVCACVAIVCAVLLIRYLVDFMNARELNRTLAAQYHAESTESVTAEPQPTTIITEPPAPTVSEAPAAPVETQVPAAETPAPQTTYDPFGGYPNNRYREISARFKKLQRTNPDICGWITIGFDLDQAVVQRNNEYYLNRDYTGQHNSNGAIFLDEQIELWQRPTCYILYGHNMKTEAMFGMLHKYDKISYLREHPIITFNTQYEDGEFAIFSIGTIALEPGNPRFSDYYNLPHAAAEARQGILNRIKNISEYSIPLDVTTDDQVLILVTCVGDDRERRIVAARRLRDGEDQKSLNMTYLLAEKR